MKEFIKNLYQALFKEDLLKTVVVEKECPISPKTKGQDLLEFAQKFYNTDPTPNDEQPDDVACVHSLTTIVNRYLNDFPVMTFTPRLLEYIQKDKRFKEITEFKEGAIIISPTNTGNGQVIGHCGIIAKGGKILSNASSTGLWFDKYNQVSWVDRYSRKGRLELYVFELL